MAGKTYEMMWDCEYCGSKKLLGKTHRHCPECGAPQNPSKRYFPPDHEKVAVEDHVFVGADQHCPACREPQSAAVKHCTNCGSPIAGGKGVARHADVVLGPGGAPVAPAPEKKGGGGKIIAIIGVVVLLVVAFFVVRTFWTQEAAVEVTGHSWKREIAIERFEEVEESGACKDMPRDAKVLRRSKPEPKCVTRKIDQGDGTFKEKEECDEPVERCTYRVTKWKVARTLKESGRGLDGEPVWPKVKLSRTGSCLGCEREGRRTESYVVHFTDTKSGDDMTCSFSDASKWKKFDEGTTWRGEKRVLGGDLDCGSLAKP